MIRGWWDRYPADFRGHFFTQEELSTGGLFALILDQDTVG